MMHETREKIRELPPELEALDDDLGRMAREALHAESNALPSGFADGIVAEAARRQLATPAATSPAAPWLYKLAATFAGIAILGTAMMLWMSAMQPVGVVTHTASASGEGTRILRGDTLHGGSGLTAQLDSGRVHLMLDHDAVLKINANDEVTLSEGSAWFHVRSNSGHFAVMTPQGEVTVIGTSFGVELVDAITRVQVTRGKVRTIFNGSESTVSAGETIASGSAANPSPSSRPPDWVTNLVNEETQDRLQLFFPSAAPVE